MMTDKQLRELLATALKNKAPAAYNRMLEAGTLKEYLEGLMGVTLEAISEARQDAIAGLVSEGGPTFEPDPLARTQAINMATKAAEEIALAQAMETIEALSAESATTTASSPAS